MIRFEIIQLNFPWRIEETKYFKKYLSKKNIFGSKMFLFQLRLAHFDQLKCIFIVQLSSSFQTTFLNLIVYR